MLVSWVLLCHAVCASLKALCLKETVRKKRLTYNHSIYDSLKLILTVKTLSHSLLI